MHCGKPVFIENRDETIAEVADMVFRGAFRSGKKLCTGSTIDQKSGTLVFVLTMATHESNLFEREREVSNQISNTTDNPPGGQVYSYTAGA